MNNQEYATKDFSEAIEYLLAKTNLDTDRWSDAADASIQDARFTVAGAKGELLQQLREITEKEIASGANREDFLRDFDRIVANSGWDYTGGREWRSALILMTNLRNSYGEGRCQQMNDPDVIKKRPYRMWVHGDSIVPRPHHLAMNGKVFRADHPIAQIRLPWGFGCKCDWVSLSQADLVARGLEVDNKTDLGDLIEYTDKKGKKRYQALEPDRGFGSACKFETEQERKNRRTQQQLDSIRNLPPSLIGFALMAAVGVGTIGVIAAVELSKKAIDIIIIDDAVDSPNLDTLAKLAKVSPVISIPGLLQAAEYSANEASKEIRKKAYKDVAEYLSNNIDSEKIAKAKEILSANKDKQLNVLVDGAGDRGAEIGISMAQSLKKLGLPGDIFVIPNQMGDVFTMVVEELQAKDPLAAAYFEKGLMIANALGIEIKTPEDLLKIPTPFIAPIRLALKNAVLKLIQASFDSSLSCIEKIIDLIIEKQAGHFNMLGYSAGSIITEDLVAVFAELGLPVDNLVTWGGMNIPAITNTKTTVRRYVSDADFVNKVFGLPDPTEFDRFFEDIIHSPIGKSNKEKLKSFPLNKQILRQTIEDLNSGLLQPPMQKLELQIVKEKTQTIDINSLNTREIQELFNFDIEKAIELQNKIRLNNGLSQPSDLLNLGEIGQEIIQLLPQEQIPVIKKSPITKTPSRQDIELLRLDARNLPFKVSLTTNQYPKSRAGTIDISPRKGKFTPEQISLIKKWLQDNDFEVPVASDDKAFEDGFRFLKKVDNSPKQAQIAVQDFPQKLRGQANLLQNQAAKVQTEIADLEALKQKTIDDAIDKLNIDENNPYIKDIKSRFDKKIAKKIQAAKSLQSQAEQYLIQAEQAELLSESVQKTLAITTLEELNIEIPNPELQIGVINLAQEIATRNERLTKAIEELPKLKGQIQIYQRAVNDLDTFEQLVKALTSEINRLNKKKETITKTIRSVEELLNSQGLAPDAITRNTKIIATSREQLAQIESQLLTLTNSQLEYNQQITAIKPFAEKAKAELEKLQSQANALEFYQIPADYKFIEDNLKKLKAIDELQSADPETSEKLPRENLLVPPQPKPTKTFEEQSFVRRAWAEKYAQKTGGQILVQRNSAGKNIYRVVPRQD